MKVTTPSAAAEASADFEKYWNEAEEVTQKEIDKMVQNADVKEERKEDRASLFVEGT